MRLFCVCSYKGTNYFGWERQNDKKTIQGEIEKAIGQILNREISIFGSGRTDAGVHAFGQTFHFDIDECHYSLNELLYRINCVLPQDIKILSIEEKDIDFHARYDVKRKTYCYNLSLHAKDPFKYETYWLIKINEFDYDLFNEACHKFVGRHNFINFTSKEEDKDDFFREIYEINPVFDRENGAIHVTFIGNGFMRYQIRFMMGTIVAIATKKEDISYIENKLKNVSSRSITIYKGQPQGLTLVSVNYK